MKVPKEVDQIKALAESAQRAGATLKTMSQETPDHSLPVWSTPCAPLGDIVDHIRSLRLPFVDNIEYPKILMPYPHLVLWDIGAFRDDPVLRERVLNLFSRDQ